MFNRNSRALFSFRQSIGLLSLRNQHRIWYRWVCCTGHHRACWLFGGLLVSTLTRLSVGWCLYTYCLCSSQPQALVADQLKILVDYILGVFFSFFFSLCLVIFWFLGLLMDLFLPALFFFLVSFFRSFFLITISMVELSERKVLSERSTKQKIY